MDPQRRFLGSGQRAHLDYPVPPGPVNIWTGMCTTPFAATLRDKDNYVDLTGLAKVRWTTRASGFHAVRPLIKLTDGTFLVGDHAESSTTTFLESEFAFAGLRWMKLDIGRVVTTGRYGPVGEASNWADAPDLSKVDEAGFVDLMPGSGHGSGGYVNVASFELYGAPVKLGRRALMMTRRIRVILLMFSVFVGGVPVPVSPGPMAGGPGSERPARFQRQTTWRCAGPTDSGWEARLFRPLDARKQWTTGWGEAGRVRARPDARRTGAAPAGGAPPGGPGSFRLEAPTPPFPYDPNGPPVATFFEAGANMEGGLPYTQWAKDIRKKRTDLQAPRPTPMPIVCPWVFCSFTNSLSRAGS